MRHFLKSIYQNTFDYETRLRVYKLRHPLHFKKKRTEIYPSSKGDFSLRPFDEHHCIFVHITKTAGTSVAKSLFGYLPYHYTAIDYRVIYGKKTFDGYFKFAFVRNPWDRLYSAYRYLMAGGWNDDDRKWAEENISQYTDFNDFVENWLNPENIKKHIHFRPQYQFICDSKGKILIDYLAYYETINNDFEKISRHLKLDATLGKHNTNPGDSYLTIYTPENIRRVNDVYATDINLFGYDFHGIVRRTVIE